MFRCDPNGAKISKVAETSRLRSSGGTPLPPPRRTLISAAFKCNPNLLCGMLLAGGVLCVAQRLEGGDLTPAVGQVKTEVPPVL